MWNDQQKQPTRTPARHRASDRVRGSHLCWPTASHLCLYRWDTGGGYRWCWSMTSGNKHQLRFVIYVYSPLFTRFLYIPGGDFSGVGGVMSNDSSQWFMSDDMSPFKRLMSDEWWVQFCTFSQFGWLEDFWMHFLRGINNNTWIKNYFVMKHVIEMLMLKVQVQKK